jgi:hypothetical protein
MRRNAAYYVAGYCYYLGSAVASRGFFYGKVRYRIGLGDRAVRNTIAEGIADRVLVGMKAIRRNLGHSDNPVANVILSPSSSHLAKL